jgi:hypothetical protein
VIEVSGRNGSGYRIFYPWFHHSGKDLKALRIPEAGLVRRCILFNAPIAFTIAILHMEELRGHPSPSDGWIYLIAFALLIVELAWKAQYLWSRIRIERPSLVEIPTSSRLRGEHVLFWMTMQTVLIALIDDGHPVHYLFWIWATMLCTLMALMPMISTFILRRRRSA